ncbi:hypothetical protein [Hydrogenophaga sp.]|uniref:hypothetical protein n=1 Tax=Hydrogenophaga sp. TaxID=1904254 RepID=UPI00271B1C67|nr:hypothetical protein [Hydrogenophaga sp.]MDO9134223.1 hypothetical protein [Hydrogenophaga sp.]
MTEDELELFDLLKKDGLTKDEEQRVKLAAKHLLRRLVEEQPKVLVQDWYKDAQTQSLLPRMSPSICMSHQTAKSSSSQRANGTASFG